MLSLQQLGTLSRTHTTAGITSHLLMSYKDEPCILHAFQVRCTHKDVAHTALCAVISQEGEQGPLVGFVFLSGVVHGRIWQRAYVATPDGAIRCRKEADWILECLNGPYIRSLLPAASHPELAFQGPSDVLGRTASMLVWVWQLHDSRASVEV